VFGTIVQGIARLNNARRFLCGRSILVMGTVVLNFVLAFKLNPFFEVGVINAFKVTGGCAL